MYIYQAELWCNACGEKIQKDLIASGKAPADTENEHSFDSDDFPKYAWNGDTDSPNHCPSGDTCLGDAVDLGKWGLGKKAKLYGSETRVIGELLDESLTSDGVEFIKETLKEKKRTPYQRALYKFWTAVYGAWLD
jgi:hypothetical protein